MTFTNSGRKSERWTFEEVSTSHDEALLFTHVTDLLVRGLSHCKSMCVGRVVLLPSTSTRWHDEHENNHSE